MEIQLSSTLPSSSCALIEKRDSLGTISRGSVDAELDVEVVILVLMLSHTAGE